MGLGGGSLAGGAVLVVYLVTIGLCGMAWTVARSRTDMRTWIAIMIALALLALEKVVHLEARLTRPFERIAQYGGWYETRYGVQLQAIAALTVSGVLLAIATIRLLRRAAGSVRIAAAATVLLIAFVAVRTVSLHQLDRLLASAVGPLRISNIIELTALCVIGSAAWRAARVRR